MLIPSTIESFTDYNQRNNLIFQSTDLKQLLYSFIYDSSYMRNQLQVGKGASSLKVFKQILRQKQKPCFYLI